MNDQPSQNEPTPYAVCAFLHHPATFCEHSGMYPLTEALRAEVVRYEVSWEKLQAKSWTLGYLLKRWGNAYYQSEWNALIPWYHERLFAQCIRRRNPDIVHFLWGEFATPFSWKSKQESRLIGTFHASQRRLPTVLKGVKHCEVYDGITLMSETQKTFFLERNYPEERLAVILHGVDLDYFRPSAYQTNESTTGPIKALIVGSTERDHAFMAKMLKKMPDGVIELSVATSLEGRREYENVPHVTLLPFLDDNELVQRYQTSDLLIMPLLDCTANNAVLEAMACGTPVMTHRIGGISEYVSEDAGYVLDGKDVDTWVAQVVEIAGCREALQQKRAAARAWACRFNWNLCAKEYEAFYEKIRSLPPRRETM